MDSTPSQLWASDSGLSADERDWDRWFAQQGASLVLYALQWCESRSSAEDAVQDGFVRFWRSRSRVRDATAYLYACVKSAALNARRSQARRQRREQHNASPEALFDCPPEHDERRRAIEEALARLPGEQREVLVMRIWGELSFPQIGESLEISANTASSRYRYALQALRRILGATGVPTRR